MRKLLSVLLALLVLVSLLLSACGHQAEPENIAEAGISDGLSSLDPVASQAPPQEASVPQDSLTSQDTSVLQDSFTSRDYGSPAWFRDRSEDIAVQVCYPTGDCQPMEDLLTGWLAQATSLYAPEEGHVSLRLNYDTYRANNRLQSVVFTGTISPSHDSNLPFAAAFTVDRVTGEQLSLDDLLTEDGRSRLLDLAAQRSGLEPSDALLDCWVPTASGLRLYFTGSDTLQTVDLTYSELDGILSLPQPPQVALTFDDGPSFHTPQLLDLLDRCGGHVTFCVVGNRISSYSETIQRANEAGHEFVLHSWDHSQLTQLSQNAISDEMTRTLDALSELGVTAQAIRPPYGSSNGTVKEIAKGLGLYLVNWSVDTEDWESKDADTVAQAVLDQAKDGAIILSHDLYGSTIDAMEIAIPELINRGFELVTVTELLTVDDVPPTPGEVYHYK